MNAENSEITSGDLKIRFVDTLPKDLENRRERGHMEHEASKGIVCDYKKFFITIENETDEVVGVLEAYTAFSEIYIEDLWVDAKHRGRGYGTNLVRALEKRFQGQGYNNINLVTSEFSAPEFYKKCGFEVEFVRKNNYNPRLTKTFFIKYFDDQVQTQGVLAEASTDKKEISSLGGESIIYTEEPLTEVLKKRIQSFLRKVREKSQAQCKKSKQKEEFPLRGLLTCPSCSSNLTGSRSRSRNGNYYCYYHCQSDCKTRFNVDELHEALDDHLKSLTIPAEVSELYLAILEDTFKSQEGDREKQFQGLKEQITGCNDKMLRCDEMRIEGEIPKDSHQRLMSKYKDELAILKQKIEVLQSGETNFMKYCRYGIPLMSNLPGFYNQASVAIKQKLLGSIFPARLHFRDGSYRTTPINPALALILQKNKVLENEKTGQELFSETLSGQVPMAGLEPTPCCQE